MSDRTPIERMIDEATGFDPSTAPKLIDLHCPKCDRTEKVPRNESDPPGATAVIVSCPDCWEYGDEITYENWEAS